MGLITYFLDLLKNKDYNSAYIFTGSIFILIFPSLMYLVLFEIDFILNVEFSVLLLLVLVYNIMLTISSALIFFEHQFPLVVGDARLANQRNEDLTKSIKEIEERIDSILSNKDENAESHDAVSIRNQASSVIKEAKQGIEYSQKIIDQFFTWVLIYTILFGFVLTLFIMITWSIGFDLKNLVRSIDNYQLVLMALFYSWIISIYRIFKFNKNNSNYKIKYRWRFIQIGIVVALLVYLNR